MPLVANQTGTCPHCRTPNRFETVVEDTPHYGLKDFDSARLVRGTDQRTWLKSCRCTHCGELILFLDDRMIYPLGASRAPAPEEVPKEIAEDFNEACLVESLSKKASAALARRCLQNTLHERGIQKANLSDEITAAMTTLPSYLSTDIDSIRNIGNFAAHPKKSTVTGAIIEVEDGETEWILDVLEQLFDFYYVQPERTKAKRVALNKKLAEIGKPAMK